MNALAYSESIAAFAPAFVELQAAMPKIPKDKTGQAGNRETKYADLETTIELVKPLLAEHGFAFLQPCSEGSGGQVAVTTILLHKSGEWMRDTLVMPTGGSGAQAVGSAISYAKRYALTSMLGLATEDDDGHAASQQPARRQTRQQPRAADASTAPPTQASSSGGEQKSWVKAVNIELAKHGITVDQERWDYCTAVTGRDIASTSDLSKDEANTVIARLRSAA
jgi:hypothetical protein